MAIQRYYNRRVARRTFFTYLAGSWIMPRVLNITDFKEAWLSYLQYFTRVTQRVSSVLVTINAPKRTSLN